jgi:hypothetical protein
MQHDLQQMQNVVRMLAVIAGRRRRSEEVQYSR